MKRDVATGARPNPAEQRVFAAEPMAIWAIWNYQTAFQMRQNLSPKVWGPQGWDFLHHCLTASDESSRVPYLQLLHLLPAVLPCASCREHAALYILKNPPEDAPDLKQWLLTFREVIAERVRGPQQTGIFAYRLVALLTVLLLAALTGLAVQGFGGFAENRY